MYKRKILILLSGIFLIALLFPFASLAAGNNSITIVATSGASIVHPIYEEPEEELTAIVGIKFTLWKLNGEYTGMPIGNTEAFKAKLAELAKLSISELNAKFGAGIETEKTDATGKTTVTGLNDGRYYIIETEMTESGPKRVVLSTPMVVDVPYVAANGETLNDITVYPKMAAAPSGVTLIKYKDRINDKNVFAGAKFSLFKIEGSIEKIIKTDKMGYYDETGEKSVFVTDEQGKIVIPGLPAGKYVFKEIEIPEGYMLSNPKDLEFVLDDENLMVTVKALNKKPGSPGEGGEKFLKVSEKQDGEHLKGATFKLMVNTASKGEKLKLEDYKDSEGNPYVVTSNSVGEFEFINLPYGTYYVLETTTPEGYNPLDKPIEIEITEKSYADGRNIVVVNKKLPPPTPGEPPDKPGKNMPKTGDIQIYLYAVIGFSVLVLGVFLYKLESKSET